MNRRNPFGTPAAGAALALSGVLCLVRLHGSAAQNAAAQKIHAQTTSYRAEEVPNAATVTVSVDATKTLSADRDALEAVVKKAGNGLPPLPESYAAAKELGGAGEWFRWGRLADNRANLSVFPAPAESALVSVYAVADSSGASALLVNSSAQTVTVRYRIRLGRGAYELRVLRFASAKSEISPAAQVQPLLTPNREKVPNGPAASAESGMMALDGCDFGAVRTAERIVMMAPGETALIRASNVARATAGAYYHAREILDDLQDSSPGLARRLRQMLRNGEGSLKSLTAGGRGSGRRIEAIHHLLLVNAQAQALERNYLRRGSVKYAEGAALADALTALSDGLSQTSAVILNLVPQIEVLPDTRGGAKVAVSLRNGGTSRVESVKLGLDEAALPAKTTCNPPDPAYFDALKPGQSVETTFEVRSRAGAILSGIRYTADVSYRIASSPAHLRPRSQF